MFIFISIVCKNVCTSKAEHLAICEKLFDAFVRIAKLRTVALVENENNPFIFQISHFLFVLQFANGCIEFLNGGNNQFGIFGFALFVHISANKLLYQIGGIVRAINTTIAKTIKFFGGLIV